MGRRRTGTAIEWGKDALRDADFSNILRSRQTIVSGVGQEAVDVYRFLAEQFEHGSVTENLVFQFVYRSFYVMDGAGLTQEFKTRYFELMEAARGKSVDIRSIAKALFDIPNAKGQDSLQFSFATKLGHTVDVTQPLYDVNIATYFRFRPANSDLKDFDNRVQPFMLFHDDLRSCYQRILANGVLADAVQSFRNTYGVGIPDVKILDFIFHTAGRAKLSIVVPSVVAGV